MLDEVKFMRARPYPVSVGVVDNKKAFRKALKEMGVPKNMRDTDPNGYATTHFFGTPKGTFVVMQFPKDMTKNAEEMCPASVIAHECMHAVQIIFQTVGEDSPSMEAEAYLLDEIVEFAFRELGYAVVKRDQLAAQAEEPAEEQIEMDLPTKDD